MSGLDDLGRALRDDAAANAPRASVIDVEAVARAARARRRPRVIGLGAVALVGGLGLGGIAVAAVAPPVLIAAGETTTGAEDAPAPESVDLLGGEHGGEEGERDGGGATGQAGGAPAAENGQPTCGEPASAAVSTSEGLRLEALLPAIAPAGSSQLGSDATAVGPSGTVRIINTGAEPRAVLTRPEAVSVLLRDGIVVGAASIVGDAGLSTTLDPGAVLELPVRLVTVACTDGAPLPPGDYTVQLRVSLRSTSDGPTTMLVSPALPLRVE
ncbi:hypothetical protein [Microcella frigidaquae]|uniref:Uncharacterized protein n=1 Tax=Microcella frigidaquae TaxID=424758 RepID=A0A840XSA2_9MICO|nr:hypothetical protein [Microcella frigidaquae]MBB5618809.1 hypothetical protein [Microcella frigidaquae]NHN44239.1 hypothetical protein [Microcella frigidaquae]